MIEEKLKELQLQINNFRYEEEMIDRLKKVWIAYYALESEVKKFHKPLVLISLPMRERLEIIYNAMRNSIEKRKEQGYPMTHIKQQMYEVGFDDAIGWILGNEL